MQAAAAPSESVTPGPQDWLGYQRYADALWTRIVHNFALDADARSAAKGRAGEKAGLPTGDPLVVGVYGEWGVGKSRLLELMYQLAARQNVEDCLQRARDPQAYATSPALRLTVPVWFHPWKYEHEPHLAVPLLMHLAEAIQRTLGQAASFQEQALDVLKERGEDAAALAIQVKKAAKTFQAAAKVAHVVAGNGLVKTTASLAAGYFGFGAVADRALDWVEETAGKFLPVDEQGGKPAAKEAAKEEAGEEKRRPSTPQASADGRYYYNVHRYLNELTRITGDRARELGHAKLRHDIQLNFVVFVDDLDRCLPEKAVEVLEVIKTVLNVDSFAFVIALDDEVIERGISYRYREYRFQNAKPEMPITGFEYLEKIVHLPFRLPQLTRTEAVKFLFKQEQRLLTPTASDPVAALGPARLWFLPDPVTGELQPSPLVHLLLDSFDAFVPRKLSRTLELMHQFQQVFMARGTPIQPPPTGFTPTGTAADARMMLFCVLLQLFAPEIFRLLRRRPELFGHWMRAYLVQDATRQPAFVWQKTTGDQLMTLEVSDADLYRWVALGSGAGTLLQAPPPGQNDLVGDVIPFNPRRDEWGKYLGDAQLSSSDRYSVEQIRLPLAAALSGFREMQRHAFAPLRLGGAMAYATGWTAGAVPRLQEYLNLFSDQEASRAASPSVAPIGSSIETAPVRSVQEAILGPNVTVHVPVAETMESAVQTQHPIRQVNPRQLLELLRSPDASTRAALVERSGLQPGEWIDEEAVVHLASGLQQEHDLDGPRIVEALASLAPFLSEQAMARTAWPELPKPMIPKPSLAPETCVDAFRPYVSLALYKLDKPLNLGKALALMRGALLEVIETAWAVSTRAEAADQLGIIGDPRFEFDSKFAFLPAKRALVQDQPDEAFRETRLVEEPLPGFVQVVAGGPSSQIAIFADAVHATGDLKYDFFLSRTLVTVQQFQVFVADGGYGDQLLWDPDGRSWLNGVLEIRAPSRHLPVRWSEQLAKPTRPVTGINWYEARAYAAWLRRFVSTRFKGEVIDKYQIRLPSEQEWERAAKAKDIASAEERDWPWSNRPIGIEVPFDLANVDLCRLGRTSAVGLFPPNPLGIHDLAGNVSEWMDNSFDSGMLRARIESLDSAPQDRQQAMALRGGSWRESLESARCTARQGRMPWEHDDTVGMRVALVPKVAADAA